MLGRQPDRQNSLQSQFYDQNSILEFQHQYRERSQQSSQNNMIDIDFAMVCECGQRFNKTSELNEHIFVQHNPETGIPELQQSVMAPISVAKKRIFRPSYRKIGQQGRKPTKSYYKRKTRDLGEDGVKQYFCRRIYMCGTCETLYEYAQELRFHVLTAHQGNPPDGTIYGLFCNHLLRYFKIPEGKSWELCRRKREEYENFGKKPLNLGEKAK